MYNVKRRLIINFYLNLPQSLLLKLKKKSPDLVNLILLFFHFPFDTIDRVSMKLWDVKT